MKHFLCSYPKLVWSAAECNRDPVLALLVCGCISIHIHSANDSFAFMILERLALVWLVFSLPAEYEVVVGAFPPLFFTESCWGNRLQCSQGFKKKTAHMNVTVREVLISDRLIDRLTLSVFSCSFVFSSCIFSVYPHFFCHNLGLFKAWQQTACFIAGSPSGRLWNRAYYYIHVDWGREGLAELVLGSRL